MTYTAYIDNAKKRENIAVLEWADRPMFTKDQFDTIVREMFFWSCTLGVDADLIKAPVYAASISEVSEDGDIGPAFTLMCESTQDGSSVYADIYVDGYFLRRMTIAD